MGKKCYGIGNQNIIVDSGPHLCWIKYEIRKKSDRPNDVYCDYVNKREDNYRHNSIGAARCILYCTNKKGLLKLVSEIINVAADSDFTMKPKKA